MPKNVMSNRCREGGTRGATSDTGHRDGQVRFGNGSFNYHPRFDAGTERPGVVDEGPDHKLSWFLARLEGRGSRVLRGEVILPRRRLYRWGPILSMVPADGGCSDAPGPVPAHGIEVRAAEGRRNAALDR